MPAWASPAAWRGLGCDAGIVAGLAIVAAVVRVPNAHLVPPYTDETEEALRAWAIAEGELRPLVNVDAYIGALWSYVVAAGFALVGRSAEVPRLAAVGAGALTVGVTFLLGRRLYGTMAGLMAALLLAGNAAHVLVNGHVAWSNCATPLFTTIAFWLLIRALDRPEQPLRLGLAGLAWGLALQTHPSVAAFLIGAAGYALWRDPRLPLRPGAWLGLGMLAVGYSNVLASNLGGEFDTLTEAQGRASGYAGDAGLDAWEYVASVLGILVLIVHTTAGMVEPRMTAAEYLTDPRVLATLVVLLAALVWSARRREPLLLFIAVPAIVLIPALNQRWSPILASRYIMPLVPLALVTIAGLFVALVSRRASSPAAWGAGLGVAGLVTVVQLGGLWTYYQVEIAAGRSNDGPWRMVRRVEVERRDDEPFVVHADLHLLPLGGGGTWAKALNYLLELEDIREDVSPREPDARLRACDVASVVLRSVDQDEGRRPSQDDVDHDEYWIARQAPLAGERRDDPGRAVLEVPYSLPWVDRSLFDPDVPTFETGCG
jgi:hypothetical protein